MKFKHKMAVIISSLLIIISSFVINNKFINNYENTNISLEENSLIYSVSTDSIIPTIDTVDTVEVIKAPDTTEVYNEKTKTFDKYVKVIKYEITEHEQEETFVFTEGREYIIGSNSDDIFIYFSKQTNIDSNKNITLKFIENGKAITYVCKETENHHLKFRVISSKDKKDPYEATIYFVVSEK